MTLRRLLRQNGAMSRQDRAFVTEVVNGTLRNLIYIDHVLNTFSKTKTEKMFDMRLKTQSSMKV